MSHSADSGDGAKATTTVWNVPNQITAARLVVTVGALAAVHVAAYGWALALFCLAAFTDFLDGYLARAWNQITKLGRILDPLADKILISGMFIYLSSIPGSLIPAWLTVVVIVREMSVTVVRSFLEQEGHDFSANMPGKLKMVFQCAAVIGSLLLLYQGDNAWAWLPGFVKLTVWVAMLTTVYSGLIYGLGGVETPQAGFLTAMELAEPYSAGIRRLTVTVLTIAAFSWAQIASRLIKQQAVIPFTERRAVPWGLAAVLMFIVTLMFSAMTIQGLMSGVKGDWDLDAAGDRLVACWRFRQVRCWR